MRILSIFCNLWLTQAFPHFKERIPNGNQVPSPCDPSEIWPGVGHDLISGAGPFNPFGRDFAKANLQWTPELCRKDSDGDGKSNGEELGDPDCSWRPGATPLKTTHLSHPGICDPLNSVLCRGKDVAFLQKIPSCHNVLNYSENHWCPPVEKPDVKKLELRFNEVTLPAIETNYFCQAFTVPNDKNYHIIAWEPIIDNPQIMHHMIVFICDTPQSSASINKVYGRKYVNPEECGLAPPECSNLNIGWGFGFEGRCFDEKYGLKMGKSSFSKLILQIHYNNPLLVRGLKDASGIRLFYTDAVRQFDAAKLRIGQFELFIPPKAESVSAVSRAFETDECSRFYLTNAKNETFNLIAMGFHMHKYGKWARIFLQRANGTRETLLDDAYFYDRPNFIEWPLENGVQIRPGDDIILECVFSTTRNSNWTKFGPDTSDEMCLADFEIVSRPRNLNFVDLSTYGFAGRCELEKSFKTGVSICSEATIVNVIRQLRQSGQLIDKCSGIRPVCCDYLEATINATTLFDNFSCIYSLAYSITTSLVNETDFQLTNHIYDNIVGCNHFSDWLTGSALISCQSTMTVLFTSFLFLNLF